MSVISVAGIAVAAAGLAYSAYSASNAPKSPKQATQALNAAQVKLPQLQAQLASTQAAGKDTSSIQKKIDATNTSISFLTNWINNYGNTIAPKVTSATGGTPVDSPVIGGANQPGQTNWPLVIGGGALAIGAGVVVIKFVKKRKKKA